MGVEDLTDAGHGMTSRRKAPCSSDGFRPTASLMDLFSLQDFVDSPADAGTPNPNVESLTIGDASSIIGRASAVRQADDEVCYVDTPDLLSPTLGVESWDRVLTLGIVLIPTIPHDSHYVLTVSRIMCGRASSPRLS